MCYLIYQKISLFSYILRLKKGENYKLHTLEAEITIPLYINLNETILIYT